MGIPRQVAGLPASPPQLSPPPSSGATGRRKAGLRAVAAVLTLVGLTACEGRSGESLTGVAPGPARNASTSSDNRSLEVTIRQPKEGETVTEAVVTIKADAKAGNEEVAGIDLFIGEQMVASSTDDKITYDWSTAGYSGGHTVTAVASDAAGNSARTSVTVFVESEAPVPGVLSVAVNPYMVTGGAPSTGTVGLTDAAPEGGIVVTLASSDASVASVPASVTVPAGETVARFPISTAVVEAMTGVTISATTVGPTETATLTVLPGAGGGTLASLTIADDLVVGGESAQATVTLAAASDGDTPVFLISSDESVATVPPSVTVPAGATSAIFTITTLPNTWGEGLFAVISGHAGGVTRSDNITTVPQ